MSNDTGELQRVKVPFKQRGLHRAPVSVKARLALSLSIAGILLSFPTFGFLSCAAMWVSVAAMADTEGGNRDGHTMSIVGMWLSIIGMAIGGMFLIGVLT